jgi:hypothetical protein
MGQNLKHFTPFEQQQNGQIVAKQINRFKQNTSPTTDQISTLQPQELITSPMLTGTPPSVNFTNIFEYSNGSSPLSDHTASSFVPVIEPSSSLRPFYSTRDRYRSSQYLMHRESPLQNTYSERDHDTLQSESQPHRQTKISVPRKYRQSSSGDGISGGSMHHAQPRAIHPGKIRGFWLEANKTPGLETKNGVKLAETDITEEQIVRF